MAKELTMVDKTDYWAFEYFDDRFDEYKELAIGSKEDLLKMLEPFKNEDGSDQVDEEGIVVTGIYPFTYTPEGD